MSYECQCHQIGGPWIAEDPNCPVHGHNGTESRITELEERLVEVTQERDILLTANTALQQMSSKLANEKATGARYIAELEADIQEYADAQPPI